MYAVLVRIILMAGLLELARSGVRLGNCSGRACWSQLQRASLQVLHVDWQPISVFPREAERFQ